MSSYWIAIIFVLSLALVSCAPSQTTIEDQQILVPADTSNTVTPIPADQTPTMTGIEATVVSTSSVDESTVWSNYQNTQAGYSVQYPSAWKVNESGGQSGEFITKFTAPNDGQGISVNVQNSEAVVQEVPDMPNTRCQQVTINGLAGLRCFDTLAFSTSTSFLSHGKQYTVVTIGKHPDQKIYQHFLESFSVTP